MDSLPKITIVTPSYNQAAYLEATLQSVLSQDYPNLEYIVMDGGSTDGSFGIIDKYSSKLAYWESHPDNGQADAIYRGFERATGEIFGFVNSDDLLLPGALLKIGNWFLTHPFEEWVVGGSVIIDPKGDHFRGRLGNPCFNLGGRVTFEQLLFGGCGGFNQPASFWRRSVFFEIGGFDRRLRFCFDYDLFFGLSRRRPSGNIREFIAAFRLHPESKTTNLYELKLKEDEFLCEKYGKYNCNKIVRCIKTFWFEARQEFVVRYLQFLLVLRVVKLKNANV